MNEISCIVGLLSSRDAYRVLRAEGDDQRGALSGHGAKGECAANRSRALSKILESLACWIGLTVETGSVVGHHDDALVAPLADHDFGASCVCVLAHVGQSFLHDPEHLDLFVRRERQARIDVEIDLELAVGGQKVDVAAEGSVEGAFPLADERARIAKRASCWAAAAASLICLIDPSGALPASSMLA